MPRQIEKAYYPPLPATTDAFGPTPPEEHLPLIRRYTLADVKPEHLYTRRVALANDAVDRTYERIPVEKLQRLAETLPGKSVLAHHNKQSHALGLWYHAHVRPSVGAEPGDHTLEAYFYTTKSPENQELRDKIDAGVIRHSSIAFRYADKACSTCGGDATTCPHFPGDPVPDHPEAPPTYFYFTGDPARYESTEASLVHLGAQRGSVITKSAPSHRRGAEDAERTAESELSEELLSAAGLCVLRVSAVPSDTPKESPMEIEKALAKIKELEKLASEQADSLKKAAAHETRGNELDALLLGAKKELDAAKAEIEALKAPDDAKAQLALDGQAYREHLKSEITRLAGILKRETSAKTLVTLAGNCGSVTLKAIHDEYAAEVEAKFPPRPIGNPMTTDKVEDEKTERTAGNFTIL